MIELMRTRVRFGPGLIFLAYVAFVSLGLPDAVLGVAWPSLAASFDVQRSALGAPLAAAACTYFASGLVAGRLAGALGIGGLLLASTALTLLGVIGYATSPGFTVFLLCAAVVGFGSGAIDAGLNTFAARHFAPQHMTWLHAAYSAGAAASPAIMTAVLARGASWRVGYAIVAAALFAVGLAFVFTRRAWGSERAPAPDQTSRPASAWSVLEQRAGRLQLSMFLIYGGLEISAGQWTYTVLTQGRAVDAVRAGEFVTAYWSCLFAGRVLLGFVVRRAGNVRLLRVAVPSAMLGACAFAVSGAPPALSAAGLGLLGFSLAPIFPGLMAETPRRLGHELAAHAVGFQVSAATVGVALIPNLAGAIGAWWGLDAVAVFIAGCAVALALLHRALLATVGD